MSITFVEFKGFKRFVDDNFQPEDLRALQNELMAQPYKGALIRGTGGARKLRFARSGQGKRADIRIIYFVESPYIFLLLAYPKSKQDNLSAQQKRIIKKLITGG